MKILLDNGKFIEISEQCYDCEYLDFDRKHNCALDKCIKVKVKGK